MEALEVSVEVPRTQPPGTPNSWNRGRFGSGKAGGMTVLCY